MTSEQGQQAAGAGTVLLIWSDPRHGVRSVGRTLSGKLAETPHGLEVIEVDLNRELQSGALLQGLARLTSERLETAALAARGWDLVAPTLAATTPRVVVALDPLSARAACRWRDVGQLRAPVLGVCLGLWVDPRWADTAVNRLAVADVLAAESAAAAGLGPERLVPFGVPVCGGFSSVDPTDKKSLRTRYKLPTDRRVVLVVTDGLDETELTGTLFQLGLVSDRSAVVFDVARDDDAASLLRRRASLYGVEARMFGKVEQAGELWAAADVVVARTHLYVEQRCVALRLPYLHLMPRHGDEQATADCYAQRGVGRRVDHVSTLAADVELQLQHEEMAHAVQQMAAISRRDAAAELARLVGQVAAEAHQILDEVLQPDDSPRPAEASAAGPLETIGAPPRAAEQDDVGALSADLEAAEAEANRQVLEHQQATRLWNGRADLARSRGEPELEREAQRLAEQHVQAMHRALGELARLSQRREELEPGRVTAARVERDFQKLEVEDALAALKRRVGRDERGD